MERLTKRDICVSGKEKTCCTHFDSLTCYKFMGHCSEGCPYEEQAWNRLADYEDTGLEPEEIKAALEGATREFAAYDELGPIDRIRELVKRDTAWRCKTQTVNRGMDVTGEYDIDYNMICPSCGAVVGDAEYNELNGPFCHRCGQRLDLPHEQAEAALKGENNG